jgi:hypothetical protein
VELRCDARKRKEIISLFLLCLFWTAAVDPTFCDYAEVNVATQDLCAQKLRSIDET